jgi:DIS3-like exonuclease 2
MDDDENAKMFAPVKNHSNKRNRGKPKNQKNSSTANTTIATTSTSFHRFPPHWNLPDCLRAYDAAAAASNTKAEDESATVVVIRGTLRMLSSGNANNSISFVACDRGLFHRDILIPDALHRNRALAGDQVFVELLPPLSEDTNTDEDQKKPSSITELTQEIKTSLVLNDNDDDKAGDKIVLDRQEDHGTKQASTQEAMTWQDDEIQMDIWNPQVPIVHATSNYAQSKNGTLSQLQRRGRVVYVIPPKPITSEIPPIQKANSNPVAASSSSNPPATRRIVGTLKRLSSGTILLTPNNKALPQFKCPDDTKKLLQEIEQKQCEKESDEEKKKDLFFQADYHYGSWKETQTNWPPCRNVRVLGESCVIEDEIRALLCEYNVDHGDEFPAPVLQDVEKAVRSGVYQREENGELGWKPTPDMYIGRRDYRDQRIFTIDPTTAKDLDDALHITQLPDGETVEVGVHIADVSYFVRPNTEVDREAVRRATTVYLVDRTIPMLPRPLCEIACSLNENVERLAFSCVWRMNKDGTLRLKKGKKGKVLQEDVWYGRTIIKSCARLDYATAQNIIEGKVLPFGELGESHVDEDLWPLSRRPTGGHTMRQVAEDVRLMHRVAMARRRLRFDNGAVALDSVKLTFQLDADGQTPLLAAPYPIHDSNRLVEEYMLLANYFTAQRLITHAKDKALLRHHPPPLMDSMDKVVAVAKAGMDFDLDVSSSASLHKSLVRLGQVCQDPLVLKCVTQILTVPMQQAEYFSAGTQEPLMWRHFALNMPYYTHFTSPIRRYPDVMVHRLLQATIDGEEAIERFPLDVPRIQKICLHCSEKQKASKEAQQRCDRIFLSLYLMKHSMTSEMGIVLSVGLKAFTVYIPTIGADALVYLEEHHHLLTWSNEEGVDGARLILLQRKPERKDVPWFNLEIKVFAKLKVSVISNENPPIDIKATLEGPWS